MHATAFNSKVAARTRAAAQIMDTPGLLSKYEGIGGLRRDLEAVAKAGNEAEAANQGQSRAKAAGRAATVDLLALFAALQKEYAAVMAVVGAVRSGLAAGGASADTIARTSAVIKNEVPLSIRVFEKDGSKKRTARRSRAQEALRAEIAKDAAALIELKEIHPALAERKVDLSRLKALKRSAEKLSGMLSDRAASKGRSRTATREEQDAVKRQDVAWSVCAGLLRELGKRDERVRMLLSEAAK
jgi:hypothetical protein